VSGHRVAAGPVTDRVGRIGVIPRSGVIHQDGLGDARPRPVGGDLTGPVEPIYLLQPTISTVPRQHERHDSDNDGSNQ
jgi:hypothetical protein